MLVTRRLSTLLLLLLQGYDMTATELPCSSEQDSEIEQCLQPLISYARNLQESEADNDNHDASNLFTLQGAHVFESLCKLYEEFKTCSSFLKCDSVGKRAMDASYGYMCNDGYEQFSKFVDCFMEVETSESYEGCKTTATNEIQSLSNTPRNTQSPLYFDRLCNVMREYLSCSKPLILKFCGKDAWKLITKVSDQSLKVSMPQCDLNEIFKINGD